MFDSLTSLFSANSSCPESLLLEIENDILWLTHEQIFEWAFVMCVVVSLAFHLFPDPRAAQMVAGLWILALLFWVQSWFYPCTAHLYYSMFKMSAWCAGLSYLILIPLIYIRAKKSEVIDVASHLESVEEKMAEYDKTFAHLEKKDY